MTRNPMFSISLAVMFLFLRNGNSPRNAHRIMLDIPELHLSNSMDEAGQLIFKVTSPTVASACRRLHKVGFLEMIEAEPPRSPGKKKTAHYHLPINDDVNALKVSRYLLTKLGRDFIESAYGRDVARRLAPDYVAAALDIELSSEERRKLVGIVTGSPNALRCSLVPTILTAVERLGGEHQDRDSMVSALFEYLNAARVIGIVDAPIDRK